MKTLNPKIPHFILLLIFISLAGCNDKETSSHNQPLLIDESNTIAYFNPIDKSIYSIKNFKTKIKLITVDDGHSTWPIYSTDGKRIAFSGSVNGKIGTYTMDSETGKDLQLVISPEGEEPEGVLDWHKTDGLICVTKNLDGNAEIYTIKDSLHLKNLTKHKHWDFFPIGHPDGRVIYWTTRDDINRENYDYDYQSVYIVQSDGLRTKKLFQIEQMTNKSVENGIFPAISPDGKNYVFMMNLDLYSISLNGENLINLTKTDSIGEFYPFFKNNSSNRVYFSTTNRKKGEEAGLNIFSVKIDGTEKTQHTFDGNNVFLFPKFKPKRRVGKGESHPLNLSQNRT